MKRKILLSIFSFFFILFVQSQNSHVTKKQMYADFDQMLEIMKDCNPQLPVRKALTGIDQLKIIEDMREDIQTLETLEQFINFLNSTLYYLYDAHASMAKGVHEFDNLDNIDVDAVNQLYQEKLQRNNDLMYSKSMEIFPLNTLYFKGKYYLKGNHGFIIEKNKNDEDTIYLMAPVVISYDSMSYSDYVHYIPFNIRWDDENKKYYSGTSYFDANKGILELEKNGVIYKWDLSKTKMDISTISNPQFVQSNLSILPLRPSVKDRKKVSYFEEDKVLYIYLNEMNPYDEGFGDFIEKVKNTGKNKEICKVIIDVRNNGGGSDEAWHALLSAIILDSLPDDTQIAMKNTPRIRKLYPEFFKNNRFHVGTFDWLPNEEFLISNYSKTYIIPDTNSLKYGGKIYILQNENVYSSAHALTSYAKHVEQLILVGEPTGLLAGRGLSPPIFQLKYSKFSFRMEPVIDVTNAKSLLDVFQDIPEIVIEIPFEEKLKDLDCKYTFDQYCPEYLYNHDYLFNEVLKLE